MITKNMPYYMSHFKHNCEAIVQYANNERYPGGYACSGDGKQYSLFLLNPHNYSCSWYEENQLTLIDENTKKGRKILEENWNK